MPAVGCNRFWRIPEPAQLGAWHARPHGNPQIGSGLLDAARHHVPVGQTTGMLQTSGQNVTGEIQHLPRGQLHAHELHTDFIDLVRLVKHHDPHGWQQLGHARLPHGHIGKEQMVVDHHHIRRQRFTPCEVDVALAKTRARGPQAVVAGGGNQRNDGRALVETRQFRQIPRARAVRPHLYLGQHPLNGAVVQLNILAGLFHPVQAQVAATPFQQGRAHRQGQRRNQLGEIPGKELVLQGLGGRGQQDTLSAEQRRDQVRECFAHTRTRFHHQGATLHNGSGHRFGHADLAISRKVVRPHLRQHPLGLKYRVHGFQQAHHAGSWGWSARAKQPIALRNAMRRFFRRLRKTSSGGCSCGPSSMRTFNTAGAIRKTINGRGKEWRFDFKALTAPSAHGHGKNATRE